MTVMPYYPWLEWEDALGKTFKPGDHCAYAYTLGRSGAIQFGEVIQINRYRANGEEIMRHVGWDRSSGTPRKLEEPSCTVTVIPIRQINIGQPGHFTKVWTDRKTEHTPHQGLDLLTLPDQKKTWQKPEHILKIDPIELAAPDDY